MSKDTEAKTKAINPFLTEYTLPDGIVLEVEKPRNQVRRLLMEQPDGEVRLMMETIAAACITKITFPAGYDADAEKEAVETFDNSNLQGVYKRYDRFSMLDQQTYTTAFELLNMPTKAIVEKLVDDIKKRKPQGK